MGASFTEVSTSPSGAPFSRACYINCRRGAEPSTCRAICLKMSSNCERVEFQLQWVHRRDHLNIPFLVMMFIFLIGSVSGIPVVYNPYKCWWCKQKGSISLQVEPPFRELLNAEERRRHRQARNVMDLGARSRLRLARLEFPLVIPHLPGEGC